MVNRLSEETTGEIEFLGLNDEEILNLIEKNVCEYFGYTPQELKSRSRKGDLPKARNQFMMLALNLTSCSLHKIGGYLLFSHCMANEAKLHLTELTQPWSVTPLEQYKAIDKMILADMKRDMPEVPELSEDMQIIASLSSLVLYASSAIDEKNMNPPLKKALNELTGSCLEMKRVVRRFAEGWQLTSGHKEMIDAITSILNEKRPKKVQEIIQ